MRISIALCLLSLSVSACRGSSAPDITGDTYVLRSVSGIELPAPYAPNPLSPTRVVADTLIFADQSVGEQRAVYEDSDGSRWSIQSRFTYVRSGSRIEISFECPDNTSCVPPPHHVGTITSEELVIDVSRVMRVPLRFQRVSP